MGFLNAIVGCVVGFASGFFGHVVAHDFCEVAPSMSRKIIEAASSWLPASIRDRYLEEWRADLRAQPGALAKLAWSFGCLVSVYQLRRQSRVEYLRNARTELVLSTGEQVIIDVPTLALVISIAEVFRYTFRWRKWTPDRLMRPVLWMATKVPVFRWRNVGQPDYDKAVKIVQDMAKGGKPRKVAVWRDGVSVDIDRAP